MDWPPGESIGRYVIVRTLGRGGMGAVYLARDTVLQRHVALKLQDPGGASRTDGHRPLDSRTSGAARVLREARATAALDHPNAVAVYDVGEIDGIAYLAMEYVRGQDLRAYVGDGTIPIRIRTRW